MNLSHKCEQIILLLDSYHDGEASCEEQTMVESHLSACADCRKRLGEIGSLVATLKTLPEIKTTVDFADRVEQLIVVNREKSKTTAKVIRFGRATWAAAAAAVVVLTLLVTQFFLHNSTFNVASRGTNDNGGQPVNAIKEEMVAAVDDNTQAKSRKEQSANDAQTKTEKMKENDGTSSDRKVVMRKVRIAQGTNERKESLDVASKPDHVEAVETKEHRLDGNTMAENERQDSSQTQSLVAFSEPESGNIAEELGITTDEDGLYAIKM